MNPDGTKELWNLIRPEILKRVQRSIKSEKKQQKVSFVSSDELNQEVRYTEKDPKE